MNIQSWLRYKEKKLFFSSCSLLFILSVLLLFQCAAPGLFIRKREILGMAPRVTLQNNQSYSVIRKTEAQSSTFNLLWLFNVTPPPDFERAIQEMIQKENGDDLIQVSWYLRRDIWVVGTVDTLFIQGTVIKYLEK